MYSGQWVTYRICYQFGSSRIVHPHEEVRAIHGRIAYRESRKQSVRCMHHRGYQRYLTLVASICVCYYLFYLEPTDPSPEPEFHTESYIKHIYTKHLVGTGRETTYTQFLPNHIYIYIYIYIHMYISLYI